MFQTIESYSKYRDLILLAEIGAFLHDIGKLSKFFVLSKAKNMRIKDFHGQILFLDKRKLPDNVKKFLFSPLSVFLGKERIKGIDLSISLSHFVCAHHGCSRCLLGAECPFKDTIAYHPLIKLLKTTDHLDASNPANRGKQPANRTVRDNFFFAETEIDTKRLDDMRFAFYEELDKFLSKERDIVSLNKFIKLLGEKYFVNALSETRKYGNDITLLDHTKAVAAYYKMYLFNYLVRNKNLPNSFFDAHFRIAKIKYSKNAVKILSYEIACCNFVLESDEDIYFIIPPINGNSEFAKFLKDNFSASIYKRDDFSPLFYGRESLFEKLKSLKIKLPEDIKEGYTEKDAINDIKKVVLFAELRRKEQIAMKLKSYLKHLENLKKGSVYNEKNLVKYFKKGREVQALRKHLDVGITMDKIKKLYGWHTSKDGEDEIYAFFNTVLSPVRPPSPVEMSKYFLREYNKIHSFKKLYEKFIRNKPIVLGRIYALFRTLNYKNLQSSIKMVK